jgi:ketosteroid isomerase-like protein
MERTRYSVRDEVRDTAESFYRAVSGRNLKAVEAAWSQAPYAVVAGPSGTLHQGWNRVRAYWEARFRQLQGVELRVRLSEPMAHAVGDVAWISGIERRSMRRDGETLIEDLRMTCVMERSSAGWQIVSYHVSLPQDDLDGLASVS